MKRTLAHACLVQVSIVAALLALALSPVLLLAGLPVTPLPPDPESGQVRAGAWLAHNEQGGRADWALDEECGRPLSHLTVKAGITEPIAWYKFGFTLDETRTYAASLRITYRTDPDEPTNYPVIGVLDHAEFKPHNEQGVSVPPVPLAPTGGEWLTVLVPLGVFHGAVLNASETSFSFDIGPTLDLGFKVWARVEVIATPE